MYNECRHIMPRGSKCHSPALLGKPWCYYHGKLHRAVSAGRPPKPLPAPKIESARGIQIALAQVLNEIKSPFADPHRAGVFLNGLHLAAQLLDHTTPLQPAKGAPIKKEAGGASVKKKRPQPPRATRPALPVNLYLR